MKGLRNLIAAVGIAGASFTAGQTIDLAQPSTDCPPGWVAGPRSYDPVEADSPLRYYRTCEIEYDFITPDGATIPARTLVTLYEDGGYIGQLPNGDAFPRDRFEALR